MPIDRDIKRVMEALLLGGALALNASACGDGGGEEGCPGEGCPADTGDEGCPGDTGDEGCPAE